MRVKGAVDLDCRLKTVSVAQKLEVPGYRVEIPVWIFHSNIVYMLL